MNTLSWLIYSLHLITSLRAEILGWGAVSLIGAIISSIIVTIFWANSNLDDDRVSYGEMSKARFTILYKWYNRGLKVMIPLICLATLTTVIVPKRETIILMAASEIGERFINNEHVNAVVDPSVDLLKTWIQRELAVQKEELMKLTNEAMNNAKDAGNKAVKDGADKVKKTVKDAIEDK